MVFQAELSRERMKVKMQELLAQTGVTYETLNKTLDVSSNPQFEDQLNLVKDLQAKIVELQVSGLFSFRYTPISWFDYMV